MRARSIMAVLAATAVLTPALPVGATPRDVDLPSLWVVDQTTRTTANLTVSGGLISSFATPRTAISSIALDPLDGTLWGVNEGFEGDAGKLVNYDVDGTVIREIPADAFGAYRGEGMAVAPGPDGSLWVVDDPDVEGRVDTVYRVARDGTMLSSFATSTYSPGATSPQAIAYDASDDTLWLTDNFADTVFNVSLTGQLLGSFSTKSSAFDELGGLSNPQGITVESATHLWITDRFAGEIVRVDRAGTTVSRRLPVSAVAPGATAATGVAFSATTTAPSTRSAMTLLRGELAALAATIEGGDGDRVRDAAKELTSALGDEDVWTADGEPSIGDGKKALDKIKRALEKLQDVTDPTTVAVGAALVDLSRAVAVDQIQYAVDVIGEEDKIAEAREELAAGDAELATGDRKTAADKYKKAFERAVEALATTGALPAGALWVGDDVTRTTAAITPAGQMITSFRTPNTALSSITVDPLDGNLWGVNEASGGGAGKLVNFDTTGTVLGEIPASSFGGFSLEGMALEPGPQGALWVVDDPDVAGRVDTVYRVSRDGARLFSFPMSDLSTEADSPQDIAYDQTDGTLWITDNGADRIFNVTTDGRLVRSIDTTTGPFVTGAAPDGLKNPQGITVESATHLWITDRSAGLLLRVAKTGRVVLQTYPASIIRPDAANPTGIAYTSTLPTVPVDPAAGTRAAMIQVRDLLAVAATQFEGGERGRVEDAISELGQAIDDARVWTVDGEPTLEEGKRALDKIKKAVEDLEDVSPRTATIADTMTTLLDVSRAAATAQLEASTAAGGNAGDIQKGYEELGEGDARRAAGDLRDAADKFKKAFEEAVRAVT